jgi:hypothetical protein
LVIKVKQAHLLPIETYNFNFINYLISKGGMKTAEPNSGGKIDLSLLLLRGAGLVLLFTFGVQITGPGKFSLSKYLKFSPSSG